MNCCFPRKYFYAAAQYVALPLVFCILNQATANTAKNAEPMPPNFVFILVDDLGWADLGCYGNQYNETPQIDALAAGGMRFTDAYSASPDCSPTRASILTGKWPARLGITQYLPGNKQRHQHEQLLPVDLPKGLPLGETTLAELLAKGGYASACIGKWHLGGGHFLPESQGFGLNIGGREIGHHQSMFAPYGGVLMDAPAGEYLSDRLAEEATKFIGENADRPFLLYLSHYAVHRPIVGKPKLTAKYEAKQSKGKKKNPPYAAMLESVDEAVGSVMQKLQELGISERTIVVFFSDNGGHFDEVSNQPLRSGKGWLYEGGIRVPMIVSWPGKIEPATVCHAPVISTDFYATFQELAAQNKTPSANETDGVSLVSLLHGEKALEREAIYWHRPHYGNRGSLPGSAVRQGDYKLIEFLEDGQLELYDLANDLGETTNLVEQLPQQATRLHKLLNQWRTRVAAKMPQPNPDFIKAAPE